MTSGTEHSIRALILLGWKDLLGREISYALSLCITSCGIYGFCLVTRALHALIHCCYQFLGLQKCYVMSSLYAMNQKAHDACQGCNESSYHVQAEQLASVGITV